MFGDVFLLERDGTPPVRAERLAFRRNRRAQRSLASRYAVFVPRSASATRYRPVVRTSDSTVYRASDGEAGPLDIAFINQFGRLTLVECKLWRNPEARRKVVAQTLDYARAVSRWSYSDLQRRVAAASGRRDNAPYEAALAQNPGLSEQQFIDETTRAMRSGRFLLVIAGDGIREDVSAMAELINRNAASAFPLLWLSRTLWVRRVKSRNSATSNCEDADY